MSGNWSGADESYMRAALAEASAALAAGEVPVGAVVVVGETVVGRGHNRDVAAADPTAHAEMIALRQAAAESGNRRLTEATAYVTLEPCPMCIGAMLHARLRRLVFGAYDPKTGAAGTVLDLCNHRGLNHRIEVNGGLLAEDCAAPLKTFFAGKRR